MPDSSTARHSLFNSIVIYNMPLLKTFIRFLFVNVSSEIVNILNRVAPENQGVSPNLRPSPDQFLNFTYRRFS